MEDTNILHLSAQNGDLESLQKLLDRETIDINSVTADGWSALHFAAFAGHLSIIKLLINAKINLDIQGKVYKRTALHYAVERSNLSAVELIVKAGADLKIKDRSNKDALSIAKEKKFTEIENFLSENIANSRNI